MLTAGRLNTNPIIVSTMDDGYAPSGDDFIHYLQAGDGDLVLFIHAGVADSRMWIPQLEAVPDGYHFVAFDQRGFGKSELSEDAYADHLDALAVMDYFSAETAVVVGCSIGAGTALQVAIAAPERVAGLVLVGASSPGFEPPDGYFESPQWPEAVKAFESGDFDRVVELDAEMWVMGHGRSMDEVDPDVIDLFVEMDMLAIQSEAARDELRQKGPDLVTGMENISAPALVLVGAHDLPDEVLSAHDLASKLSDSEAIVIDGAAHLVALEQPGAFNSALFEFLKTT